MDYFSLENTAKLKAPSIVAGRVYIPDSWGSSKSGKTSQKGYGDKKLINLAERYNKATTKAEKITIQRKIAKRLQDNTKGASKRHRVQRVKSNIKKYGTPNAPKRTSTKSKSKATVSITSKGVQYLINAWNNSKDGTSLIDERAELVVELENAKRNYTATSVDSIRDAVNSYASKYTSTLSKFLEARREEVRASGEDCPFTLQDIDIAKREIEAQEEETVRSLRNDVDEVQKIQQDIRMEFVNRNRMYIFVDGEWIPSSLSKKLNRLNR